MTSLRVLLHSDKRYGRLTRNVGKSKVNRSTTFPIAADAMIPGLANAVGLNCNEAGRFAFVEFFERHVGKAQAFKFKVACQLRNGMAAVKSIFSPASPKDKAAIFVEAADALGREPKVICPEDLTPYMEEFEKAGLQIKKETNK